MPGTIHYDFSGSVIVVTGGARGQGLSHALEFARAGADVIVFDRDNETIDGIPYALSNNSDIKLAFERLREIPGKSSVLSVDVTDEIAVKQAFANIHQDLGRIDILVNNAGVNALSNIESTARNIWDAIMDVNLLGSFLCCKYVVPIMRQAGGGRIVNISSMAGLVGVPNQVHYSTSKAGLLGLTRSLAVEAGPANITVNAVCPSLVASPQTIGLSKANPVSLSESFVRGTPYVLPGMSALKPEDVTAAVMWLASEAARYVTGTVLVVDGGMSIK